MTKKQELRKHAVRSGQKQQIFALIRLAQCEPDVTISASELDQDPLLLGVQNGVLHLPSQKLVSTEDVITKMSSVPFDAESKCPVWCSFLDDTFQGNVELIDFVQRAVGYTLTGLGTEQCWFFLWGSGANGKTTFLKALRHVFGEYSATIPPHALMRDGRDELNAIARLHGIRLACASETEEDSKIAESLIKQLTGGDEISARFLYKEYFEFQPTFKIWMFGNHKPLVRGTDLAFWRRLKLIPFLNTVAPNKQDPELESKLKDEASGILNWAVEGFALWSKGGLQEPNEVTNATSEYKSEMDTIGAFLADCCVEDPTATTALKVLFTSYNEWATENKEIEMSNKKFSQKLVGHGFERTKKNKGAAFRGLCLNTT